MLLVGVVLSGIGVVVAIIWIAVWRLARVLLTVLRLLLVRVLTVVAAGASPGLWILRVRVVTLLRGGSIHGRIKVRAVL